MSALLKLKAFARYSGAGVLSILAGVHAAWACGSSWPARSRVELAQAIIGDDRLPGPGPTMIVAGLLALAAAFVAGTATGSRYQRIGAAVVAAALGMRAVAGFGGFLPHDRRSDTFRRWNRRLYSPLCLVLAVLCSWVTSSTGE